MIKYSFRRIVLNTRKRVFEDFLGMKSVKISLAWQILIALVLGIIVGAVLHNQTESREWLVSNILSPAGDIFIRLIKMIVVPIVISTLVVGIAGVGDAKKLGRLGLKTIIYFEVITTVAIVVGLTLANVFQPGHGIDMSTLTAVDISQYEKTTGAKWIAQPGCHGSVVDPVEHFRFDGEGRHVADHLLLGALWSWSVVIAERNQRAAAEGV